MNETKFNPLWNPQQVYYPQRIQAYQNSIQCRYKNVLESIFLQTKKLIGVKKFNLLINTYIRENYQNFSCYDVAGIAKDFPLFLQNQKSVCDTSFIEMAYIELYKEYSYQQKTLPILDLSQINNILHTDIESLNIHLQPHLCIFSIKLQTKKFYIVYKNTDLLYHKEISKIDFNIFNLIKREANFFKLCSLIQEDWNIGNFISQYTPLELFN